MRPYSPDPLQPQLVVAAEAWPRTVGRLKAEIILLAKLPGKYQGERGFVEIGRLGELRPVIQQAEATILVRAVVAEQIVAVGGASGEVTVPFSYP